MPQVSAAGYVGSTGWLELVPLAAAHPGPKRLGFFCHNLFDASLSDGGFSMKMIFLIVAAGSAVALAVFSVQPWYTAHQAPSAVECATTACAVDCATATCAVVPAALPVALFPSEFTSEFTPEPESTSPNSAEECPNSNCPVTPAEPPKAVACPTQGC
jgi:hypothetical protein